MARPTSDMPARSEPELLRTLSSILEIDKGLKTSQQPLFGAQASRILVTRPRLDAHACMLTKHSRESFKAKRAANVLEDSPSVKTDLPELSLSR
jgi:hypothetical protein